MHKSLSVLIAGLVLMFSSVANAAPGQPNFMAAIYGDGEVWGTKGTTSLPAPNDNNLQSFDNLYVITNANNPNAVQLPVSEAAPGNPNYNGGRWSLQRLTWTAEGFLAHGGFAPILKSEEDIEHNRSLGYLSIESASTYFQCPLLPVK